MKRLWRTLNHHWGKALTLLVLALALSVAWWALPVRPWAAWQAPGESTLIGLSANGAVLVTCDGVSGAPLLGPVRIWDLAHGANRQIALRDIGDLPLARRGTLSPDGNYLALPTENSDSTKRRVNIIQLGTGKVVYSRLTKYWPRHIYFSPDSALATFSVTGDQDGERFVVWDLAAGRERLVLDHVDEPVAFSPDGRILVVACDETKERQVKLLDTGTGQELALIPSVGRGNREIVFDADGTRITVICYRSWRNLPSDLSVQRIHGEELSVLTFDLKSQKTSSRQSQLTKTHSLNHPPANGRRILLLRHEEDDRIILVDPETGRDLSELEWSTQLNSNFLGLNGEWWLNAQTTPDGETLAMAASLPESPLVAKLKNWFPSFDFSSGGEHEALVLYRTATGKAMRVIPEVDEYLFSSDGKFLATYRQKDHTISIWNVPPGKALGWFVVIAAGVLGFPTLLWWRAGRRAKAA